MFAVKKGSRAPLGLVMSARLPGSPRAQVRQLLAADAPPELDLDAAARSAHELLLPADAENKLHNRKLYLVRDPPSASALAALSPSEPL